MMKLAIVGGGAAGFFAAISVRENFPNSEVTIFEKNAKVLRKVAVSGGGRCNLTNAQGRGFAKAYPRGEKLLKKAFRVFDFQNTMDWFERRGVPLFVQNDYCVFPASQDSHTIIDCLIREAEALSVKVKPNTKIIQINPQNQKIELLFDNETKETFDKVIVTTGGSPKAEGLQWLERLNHKIESPVPSLFTFNMPGEDIRTLMGVVVEDVLVKIQGTKIKSEGTLLITHWGMSGPAILKLSSFGARVLSSMDYEFHVSVNWVNCPKGNEVEKEIEKIIREYPNKKLANYRPYSLPKRLWLFLLRKVDLSHDKLWQEVGKKGVNKLVNILINDVYTVSGKTNFKEEFVTCGGLSLSSIDMETLESKHCQNLFFAGEVLDIDGVTGGYNLQAAWTTAFVAAKLGVK
jgi:predicted Rossmann fold flavoprotein